MAERQLTNDTCPVCGSTSIEGWEVTIEGSLAIQQCTCGECGVSWNDVYELHEGKGELLAEGTGDVLEAKSDRFSTYLIAYADISSGSSPDSKDGAKNSSSQTTAGSKQGIARTADALPRYGLAVLLVAICTTTLGTWIRRE